MAWHCMTFVLTGRKPRANLRTGRHYAAPIGQHARIDKKQKPPHAFAGYAGASKEIMAISRSQPSRRRKGTEAQKCTPDVQPDTGPDTVPADATPAQIARYRLNDIPPAGVVWIDATGTIRTVYAVPHSCPQTGLLFVGIHIGEHWRGTPAVSAPQGRATIGALLDTLTNPKRFELSTDETPDWPFIRGPWEWNFAAERGE